MSWLMQSKPHPARYALSQNQKTRYSLPLVPVSQELYTLTNTFETTTLHVLTFHISFKWNILMEEKDLYLLTNPTDWSSSHTN